MPTPDKDLMTRLAELVAHYGHQWKKIAPIMTAEGYRDKRGNPYSDNYLRGRMKKQETVIQEKRSTRSEHEKRFEPSEVDVPHLARAVISLLTQEGQLESAVKEVLASSERTPPGQCREMSPQPERVTDRRWEKLAGTCDCQLAERFHDERRKLRLSVSQMLDYVLWNFFGKPRLSFQSERSEESEPQGDVS
jgi:hypothetical protein